MVLYAPDQTELFYVRCLPKIQVIIIRWESCIVSSRQRYADYGIILYSKVNYNNSLLILH
jgi:hypothetical protein